MNNELDTIRKEAVVAKTTVKVFVSEDWEKAGKTEV
jgi:hypothetical protein